MQNRMFNIQPHKEVVKVSPEGSVTVPKSMCEQIGLITRAECVIRNNEIIIRPCKDFTGDSVEGFLIRELMSKGFSYDALEAEYDKIRPRFYAATRKTEELCRSAFENGEELCRVEELLDVNKAGECRLLLLEGAERFFRSLEQGEARDALGRALLALSDNPYRGTPSRKLLSDFYVFTVKSGEERFDIIYRIFAEGKKVTAIVSALSIEEMYNEIKSNME
ncbi:MAG: hypothetical protein K2O14_14560 [Oscillospiraceae bacterium]|nr:hypothetical protein [Oscillospiraceae bacterium]